MVFIQDYGLPTILAGIALALDLFVNHKALAKDYIRCIIEVPKEMLLLSMGFAVTYTTKSTSETHSTMGTTMIALVFFLLLIIYALRQYTSEYYEGLANSSNVPLIKYFVLGLAIILSCAISLLFFFFAVKQCLGGESL